MLDSYTVELSSFGYESKTVMDKETKRSKIMQFHVSDLLNFGSHLFQGVCRHFNVVNDGAYQAFNGPKIELDFGLSLDMKSQLI